jgi:hypothetical protein
MFLPPPYYLIICSYLKNRTYTIRYGNSESSFYPIKAGVPQGSDFSPNLFNVYTADIPKTPNTIIATYADDTAILSPGKDPVETVRCLQTHLNLIDKWLSNWKIKINPDISIYVPFILKKSIPLPLHFQGTPIPISLEVKYLGVILGKRLTWGPHIKSKRKTLISRLHLLRPILKSKLPFQTKIIIFKFLLKSIWAYVI